jgi:hypothetical protein
MLSINQIPSEYPFKVAPSAWLIISAWAIISEKSADRLSMKTEHHHLKYRKAIIRRMAAIRSELQ